jgi:hypothetical protein
MLARDDEVFHEVVTLREKYQSTVENISPEYVIAARLEEPRGNDYRNCVTF